jgi:leucyl/phenylalanyl-tRNA--protein transferase
MEAFLAAHEAGYAHSVEVWDRKGKLVGGLYGMSIGKAFFGESQFSAAEHASKVAVAALHQHLNYWGMHLRDGKWMTPHLASLGFRSMPRVVFQELLRIHVNQPGRIGRWTVDPRLDLAAWQNDEVEPNLEAQVPPASTCA